MNLGTAMASNRHLGDITFDWNEPARVIKVEVLQDKARQLGVTAPDLAGARAGIGGGTAVTQVRDDVYLIDVLARARADERG
ncbi:efflux RND transporter permease subunit, partial [Enterobacter roggenkampii]|uniref:efflux RND transporter permease subunit n=1 Tax=Enterobacter roggenkampii TaxID=1812935 RepID=UPI0013D2E836